MVTAAQRLKLWKPIPAASARLPFEVLEKTPLPGLEPAWSRLVKVRTDDGERSFHLLDTGPTLEARGLRPTGTILALHGNPTWSYMWRGVLGATLAQADQDQAWRVIAPDHLDMGFSERLAHPEPPSVEATSYRRFGQRLNDLDSLMDALDIDIDLPLVTLGHDWGGVLSLAWAARHRQAVDAVISLNTGVHHPTADPLPAALRAAMAPGVLPSSTVLTDAFLRVTLSLAEGGLPPDVSAAYRVPYASKPGRGGIGGFVADVPARASHPSRKELEIASSGLQQWNRPALLMWGPKDPVFRDRYLDDLCQRLPHADVHRFEGAGHLLTEDRDVSQVLLTWLDDQFPARHRPRGRSSPRPAAERARLHDQIASLKLSWRSDYPSVVDMAAGPEPETLTWAEFSTEVEALAAGLHTLGVRSGDRVSLLVQPGNSLSVILYACLRLGAAVVVADAGLGLKGMGRAIRGAAPDWVIGQRPGLIAARIMRWPGERISVEALGPRAAAALGTVASIQRLSRSRHTAVLDNVPYPAGEAEAAVLFTSGSTGPAKGVVYTHDRLGALVSLLRHQLAIKPGSSLIAGFAPFALLGPAIGATSVTPNMSVTKPSTLTAEAVAEAARAGDATIFFGSPAALRNVVATASRLSDEQSKALHRIRLVLSAGAPVHPDLLDEVQRLFPEAELHTPYGMTEGLLQADIDRQQVHRAMASGQPGVCVGKPVAGVHFALAPLDDIGRPADDLVPPAEAIGVLSEIVVSAAHLKATYDRLWFTERRASRDSMDDLLWHRTGDVGHIDAEGRLWVQGRLQHVISTPNGPWGPGAVETPVDALPDVARSAAVGVGPVGTQAVVVVIEPAGGERLTVGSSPLALPEVSRRVRQACDAIPISAVLVLDELPTDIRHNSKIERTKIAAWAAEVLAGRKVAAP